ncbi:uncharacterized protein [Channa argus]|uniref:uncharacterized protein n=1 Tax=Channa argus TaxID=215402 RepID=UPI0029487694|nr:hypothetical protein Q8A73_013164 [Channa argus]
MEGAQLRLVFILLCVIDLCFGQCVILGDTFTFPEFGDCKTRDARVIRRVGQDNTHLVAVRKHDVWTPDGHYEDRVNQSSSLRLDNTVYRDTGVYEFICDSSGDFNIIQMSVVVPHETVVREGDAVKLKCYYDTTHVEAVRWLKNGKLVFQRNFSSGKVNYGEGYERKVSVSPGGYKEGNLMLTLERAQMDDEGDYICSVSTVGEKTSSCVSAGRLKVKMRDPDQVPNTPVQPGCKQNVTEGTSMGTMTSILITAAITAPTFTLFGLLLKSRCCNIACERC